MGKKVSIGNGHFCYTDNCRIHDRSGDSKVGYAAILNDVNNVASARIATAAQKQAKIVFEKLPYEQRRELAEQVTDNIYNPSNPDNANLAWAIAQKVSGKEIPEPQDLDSAMRYTSSLDSELFNIAVVREDDEVMIRSTGQRGHVMEGNSMGGGLIRVDTSDGNYDFYSPDQIAKVHAPDNGLVRQEIFAAPRFSVFSLDTLPALLDQETNADLDRAQGLQGFSNEDRLVIREEAMDAGQRFTAGTNRTSISKGQIVKYIEAERNKNRTWLDEKDQANVRKGFQQILDYIDFKPSKKATV